MSTKADPKNPSSLSSGTRRILFLDDDPARARIFLAEHSEAVWVQTVDDCIARLAEDWDEVHLDHDLGGEQFVDLSRNDCGMAVVRWLCLEPHPHLQPTHFFVHSHNLIAARLMVMQIHMAGFHVENRPFGSVTSLPPPEDPFWNQRSTWPAWLSTLRSRALRLIGRDPDSDPDPITDPITDENGSQGLSP